MHRLARWAWGALTLAAAAGVVTALSPVWPNIGRTWTLAMAALALVALHNLLSYAEDRGWIYYRKRRGSYGGLGVTSNFLNIYDPSRRHLQHAVREAEWKRDEDDDGDDPRIRE
jgi:hypothetical protein